MLLSSRRQPRLLLLLVGRASRAAVVAVVVARRAQVSFSHRPLEEAIDVFQSRRHQHCCGWRFVQSARRIASNPRERPAAALATTRTRDVQLELSGRAWLAGSSLVVAATSVSTICWRVRVVKRREGVWGGSLRKTQHGELHREWRKARSHSNSYNLEHSGHSSHTHVCTHGARSRRASTRRRRR